MYGVWLMNSLAVTVLFNGYKELTVKSVRIFIVFALLLSLSRCSGSSKDEPGGEGSGTFTHPGVTSTGGVGSTIGHRSTSVRASRDEDTTISLLSTVISVPSETFDDDVVLFLSSFQGGFVESDSLKLLSAPVRFSVSSQADLSRDSVVPRSDVRKNITVEIITTVRALEKNLMVLVYADPDTSSEIKYVISSTNLTVEATGSNLYKISFVTRETDAAFTVADTGKKVPGGYDAFVEPPPEPTDLSGTATTPADVSLTWKSGLGSTSGYVLAYGYDENAPQTCASGTVVDPDLEESVIPILDIREVTASLDVTDLEDGKSYTFRVCAINGREPPDVSEGISVVIDTPARAEAVLSWAPSNPSKATSIAVTVSGDNLTHYKYALLSDGSACADATYSDWITIETTISESLGADGSYTLCALGKISDTNEQLIATEAVWTKDTVAPGAFNHCQHGCPHQ